MNPANLRLCLAHWIILIAVALSNRPASAQQTTAFTYQGQLQDGGTNANGAYTMIFELYDAPGGGNQIGSSITESPTLANGLFSVALDFGSAAFNGNARWLDITITNGPDHQTLSPRVPVLPAPYALYAATAGTVTNGAIMNAQLAANAVTTTNIRNGAISTALIADGAVTNRNLAPNAVNSNNIANGQVVRSFNGLQDAVFLTAGGNALLFPNAVTNPTGFLISSVVPRMQFFSASGIFHVPADGTTRVMVEMWGGGGGGGMAYHQDAEYDDDGNIIQNQLDYGGGGGGAGAYTVGVFDVLSPSSYTVVVGTGGGFRTSGTASAFGNLLSATGGSAGQDAHAAGPGEGGGGGNSFGSLILIPGADGQSGDYSNGTPANGGGVWRGGGPNQPGPGAGHRGASGTAAPGLVIISF